MISISNSILVQWQVLCLWWLLSLLSGQNHLTCQKRTNAAIPAWLHTSRRPHFKRFPACFGFSLIQRRQGWKFSAKSELYQSLLVAIFCWLQISQIGKTFHSKICSIYLWLVFLFVTQTGSCVIRAISCTNKALWQDVNTRRWGQNAYVEKSCNNI